jgi:hypothetical protein
MANFFCHKNTDYLLTFCELVLLLLVLLDLSSAFDMVDHELLLERLHVIGIRDSALTWLTHYLTDRSQSVHCQAYQSSSVNVSCGVPQGSVLGQLLFSIYMGGLRDVLLRHPRVQYTIYADDIQLFISTSPAEIRVAKLLLEQCLIDVKEWLSAMRLALNAAKTEFVIFHAKTRPLPSPVPLISLDGIEISPKTAVRDLGVLFDSTLSMDPHVNNVSKASFLHLRLISKARRFLAAEQTKLLVHALVLSRIDYCSSLLFGISVKQGKKLQRIINYAARLVRVGPPRRMQETALRQLGWLPAASRPKLRLLLLLYQVVHTSSPPSLAGLLDSPAQSGQVRRSHSTNMLAVKH